MKCTVSAVCVFVNRSAGAAGDQGHPARRREETGQQTRQAVDPEGLSACQERLALRLDHRLPAGEL